MKHQEIAACIACSLAAVAATPAAGQEWELLFDSFGFDEFPLGPLPASPSHSPFYLGLLPHEVTGSGSGAPMQLPEVAVTPSFGGRAVMLEAQRRTPGDGFTQMRYAHQSESLVGPFGFPGQQGRGGYRGVRVTFDMYHVFDPDRGAVTWRTGGSVQIGGVTEYRGEVFAQLLWNETERLEPVFDEWVTVSLTFDLEHETFSGSYAGRESGAVRLPAPLMEFGAFSLGVSAAPYCNCPVPEPDTERVWVDNVMIEVVPPCPADCDLDYEHTFFDFLCFQNMFAAGSSRADCDLDGELTFFDFVCFQNYFAAGCD